MGRCKVLRWGNEAGALHGAQTKGTCPGCPAAPGQTRTLLQQCGEGSSPAPHQHGEQTRGRGCSPVPRRGRLRLGHAPGPGSLVRAGEMLQASGHRCSSRASWVPAGRQVVPWSRLQGPVPPPRQGWGRRWVLGPHPCPCCTAGAWACGWSGASPGPITPLQPLPGVSQPRPASPPARLLAETAAPCRGLQQPVPGAT